MDGRALAPKEWKGGATGGAGEGSECATLCALCNSLACGLTHTYPTP